jgi:casein kinase 1
MATPGSQSYIIHSNYKIIKQIGQGNFGTVYSGIKIRNNEPVAIKIEFRNSPVKILKHETTILNYLYQNGCRCCPTVYWFGTYDTYTCLIMPLYKYSLDTYFENMNVATEGNMGMRKVELNKYMIQCIDILKNIHNSSIVHRDIKPQNFMIGGWTDENEESLYIIDFGFANVLHNEDIPEREHKRKEHLIGTPKFVSYFVHEGYEHVLRDDLISIGYMYIYLLMGGQLPWNVLHDIENSGIECVEGIYPNTHIEYYKNKLMKMKKSWKYLEPICEQLGQPIHRYLDYCYHMGMKRTPNYSELQKLFGLT